MTSSSREIELKLDSQILTTLKSEVKFTTPTYETLFTFVKKNTELAYQVQAIEKTHLAELKEFKSAALGGKIDAPIFKDPKCWLYPLALMHCGEIEFWQGITAYFDVIAKAQFEDLPFYSKDKDANLKLTSPHRIQTILLMTDDGELTTAGIKYLSNFDDKASKLNMCNEPIDRSKLVKLLATSSPRDRMLLAVPDDVELVESATMQDKRSFDYFKFVISSASPWIIPENENGKKMLLLPSIAMLNFFQQELAVDYPVVLYPGFGTVGSNTLANMHAQHYHFVPLFNPWIKSNMSHAHNCSIPFWMMTHEFSHIGWMGRLKKSERDLIFEIFIPMLKEWENDCRKKEASFLLKGDLGDQSLFKMLQQCQVTAADFDLSILTRHKRSELFDHYLVHTVRSLNFTIPNGKHFENNRDPFGNLDDRIYFLVCNALINNKSDLHKYELLKAICTALRLASYRKGKFFDLIDKLVVFARQHKIDVSDAPIQLLLIFLTLENTAFLITGKGTGLDYRVITSVDDLTLRKMIANIAGLVSASKMDKVELRASATGAASLQKAVISEAEVPVSKVSGMGLFVSSSAPGNRVQHVLEGPKLG